jgi:large subunit ribosomal protein L22
MGKAKSPAAWATMRRWPSARSIRGSPQKLNLVATLIRGKQGGRGAEHPRPSPSARWPIDVRKVLASRAIANAENNHNLDVDSLVVAEARSARAW